MATKRVHYLPDCDNLSGNDSLAITTHEAMQNVNCGTCLDEMNYLGYFDEEDEDDYHYMDDYRF